MWQFLFLSKVEIGNQEVEKGHLYSTGLFSQRERDKLLSNNESCVLQTGSTAGPQVLVLVLNNACWMPCWSPFSNRFIVWLCLKFSWGTWPLSPSCLFVNVMLASVAGGNTVVLTSFMVGVIRTKRLEADKAGQCCVWLTVLWLTAGVSVTDK